MNRALFLDRDGVINVEKNYVHKIEDFEFVEGIFEFLHYFTSNGYLLFIITNQAGIGRGYYSESEYKKLEEWMINQMYERGITISKTYYCPFHPEYGIDNYKLDSFDRKPNPGMILKAKQEFDIDLDKSLLIGDKESDIEAGIRAGIAHNILFTSCLGQVHSKAEFISKSFKDIILNYKETKKDGANE